MFPERIEIHMDGEWDPVFPSMIQVRQNFQDQELKDPVSRIKDQLEVFERKNGLRGKRIALTVGSRGIARLMFKDIDVLIIDEIGKNISGEGIDPNVTGRPGSGLTEGFSASNIGKIVVLDITEPSHGNGVGIGMADISTLGCFRKLDISAMYTNAVTAAILDPAKIPLLTNNDREAIALALKCSSGVVPETAKVVRIKNTLEIGNVWISEALYETIKDDPSFTVLSEPCPLCFDSQGNLEKQGNSSHCRRTNPQSKIQIRA